MMENFESGGAVAKVGKAGQDKAQAVSNVVTIFGRVERSRRYEGHWYTAVICPALDSYSKPDYVEIRSKERFGDVGENCRVTCRVGGWQGKEYTVSDKATGEVRKIIPVTIFLDLVL